MYRQEVKYRASNDEHDIYGFIWKPERDYQIKGIVQIVHGMSEHSIRYEDFAEFLVNRGYAVCSNDHAGHGDSHSGLRGYLGKTDGYKHMVEDINTMGQLLRTDYENTPFIMLGHSLGSFLARYYCAVYGDNLDGIIYSGTGDSGTMARFALPLCGLLCKIKGEESTGTFFEKIINRMYNKNFQKRTSSDWLSRDESQVDLFVQDEKCGFAFTYNGYMNLFALINAISEESWADSVPKRLPTYLFAGTDDPVGDCGRGVKSIRHKLETAGCTDVTMKLYPGGRHEMLNETNRQEVYEDTIAWIDRVVERL